MFPIFVGTVLAEHLVGKLCNSLRAHGRKIQKSHYSSKMRGMYGVGTSSDVTFSLMLFNSFAKVCPARGPQRSRPSHSPHHAKLTHNTATPIKRITTAYDTWDYNNHRLQAASAIQPVDCPRRGERLLPPPFQHFIHAEGLTTTYTLRRRARISGQSLALLTDSARRTNTSFNHASVDKTTPVLRVRPTLDVAWVESLHHGRYPADHHTAHWRTPAHPKSSSSSRDKHRPHGPSPSCGSVCLDDDDALQASPVLYPSSLSGKEDFHLIRLGTLYLSEPR